MEKNVCRETDNESDVKVGNLAFSVFLRFIRLHDVQEECNEVGQVIYTEM